MDGLDLAFYKNRAFYHTPLDRLAYAEGGAQSLQAMIETIKFGGLGLLNADIKGNDNHKDPVYFDSKLPSLFKVAVSHTATSFGTIHCIG